MRLIDADKIDFNEVFIGASDFAKDTREAAQMLIDHQPTIKPSLNRKPYSVTGKTKAELIEIIKCLEQNIDVLQIRNDNQFKLLCKCDFSQFMNAPQMDENEVHSE